MSGFPAPRVPAAMVETRTGARMPVLGQGTWMMGEKARRRADEVAALRLGFDLGLTLADTAEMYADGGAEEIVGEAIAGRRDEIFVVSKVLPQNATRTGTIRACERSLVRLRTDRIDLYLLHWKGSHPLAGTLEAFQRLRAEGKIRHYGVSNFDPGEMARAERLPGGPDIAANQILYHLGERGPERRLIPWCVERGIVVMAYSPLAQGRLGSKAALEKVARRHGCGPERVALAWAIRHEGVVAIPMSSNPDHVRDNAAALALGLTGEDLAELDAAFPAPAQDVPLGMA
jgi:diketogulonate reductase-like aldo/keto reductase